MANPDVRAHLHPQLAVDLSPRQAAFIAESSRGLARDPLSAGYGRHHPLGHGLLDGCQRDWRKVYVELLDAGAGRDGKIVLTGLGNALASAAAAMSNEDEDPG